MLRFPRRTTQNFPSPQKKRLIMQLHQQGIHGTTCERNKRGREAESSNPRFDTSPRSFLTHFHLGFRCASFVCLPLCLSCCKQVLGRGMKGRRCESSGLIGLGLSAFSLPLSRTRRRHSYPPASCPDSSEARSWAWSSRLRSSWHPFCFRAWPLLCAGLHYKAINY